MKSVRPHEINPAVFVWAGVSDVRAEVSRGGPRHPESRRRRLCGAGKQHLLRTEAQARLQTAGPAGSRQRTCGWHLFNVTGCTLVYVSSQPPQRSMSSLSICLSGTPALLTVTRSSLLPLCLCHVRRVELWLSGFPEARQTSVCLLVLVWCSKTNTGWMCVCVNITNTHNLRHSFMKLIPCVCSI